MKTFYCPIQSNALYNTIQHTLPDCLIRRKLQPRSSQFIRKYSMIHRYPQIRIGDKPSHHHPYSFRTVCGFCETRRGLRFIVFSYPRGLESLTICVLDVLTKEALFPQLFKDPECWSGRDLNLRPPAQQYQLS